MTTSVKKSRRSRPYARLAVLALLSAATLVGASRLSFRLFERRPVGTGEGAAPSSMAMVAETNDPGHSPSPADGGAAEPGLFRVVGSDGEVDAFRDGRWIPIRHGDLLTPQDVVRTAPGARAVLRLGASTEIELREKVEIRLDRLSGTGASVDLRRGKVLARVARPGDKLTISASETRTSNDGPAHFIVMAEESSGRVSVAAVEGSARFSSGGKEVIVGPGTETRSERGGAPTAPETIPEDIFLSVVWPEAERHDVRAKATITGRVRPSSMVAVNGAAAAVAADGRFTAELPLRVGPNEVNVETEDLTGRRKLSAATIVGQRVRPPDLTPVPAKLWTP